VMPIDVIERAEQRPELSDRLGAEGVNAEGKWMPTDRKGDAVGLDASADRGADRPPPLLFERHVKLHQELRRAREEVGSRAQSVTNQGSQRRRLHSFPGDVA